jgi:ABC-2 type transport system permease protein
MRQDRYLHDEVLRSFRNRRFMILTLAFPLILLLSIGSANRHATLGGISFPLYFMVGMASWGATVSSGASIAPVCRTCRASRLVKVSRTR